jgi:hypothetical protein
MKNNAEKSAFILYTSLLSLVKIDIINRFFYENFNFEMKNE